MSCVGVDLPGGSGAVGWGVVYLPKILGGDVTSKEGRDGVQGGRENGGGLSCVSQEVGRSDWEQVSWCDVGSCVLIHYRWSCRGGARVPS